MMKNMEEKIQEYIDTGNFKEEVEKYIKENPDAENYYKEMLCMKESLKAMYVNVDITDRVLRKSEKRIFSWKLAIPLVASLFIVSTIVYKVIVPNYLTNTQMKSGLKAPSESTPDRSFVMVAKPEVDISTSEENLIKIAEILKKNGEIVSDEKEDSTETIIFKGTPEKINEALSEISKLEYQDISIPELKGEEATEIILNLNINK